MAVTITNPSSKFAAITPSANKLTYGSDAKQTFTAGILKDGTAGTVTCVNDNGDSVAVPFAANQFLPVAAHTVTAISAGAAYAFYQNN